jgi:hypothetical protein
VTFKSIGCIHTYVESCCLLTSALLITRSDMDRVLRVTILMSGKHFFAAAIFVGIR